MQLSAEELNEFKLEALEMIDGAEKSLLALDSGGDFKKEYDSIFRAFHNLKGSAGMLELTRLQEYMHQIETTLTHEKEKGTLSHDLIDYFLKGCDQIRKILDNDQAEVAAIAPAPKVTAQPSSSTMTSFQFVVQYYADLDTYFQMLGNEKARHELRQQVMELVKTNKAS